MHLTCARDAAVIAATARTRQAIIDVLLIICVLAAVMPVLPWWLLILALIMISICYKHMHQIAIQTTISRLRVWAYAGRHAHSLTDERS